MGRGQENMKIEKSLFRQIFLIFKYFFFFNLISISLIFLISFSGNICTGMKMIKKEENISYVTPKRLDQKVGTGFLLLRREVGEEFFISSYFYPSITPRKNMKCPSAASLANRFHIPLFYLLFFRYVHSIFFLNSLHHIPHNAWASKLQLQSCRNTLLWPVAGWIRFFSCNQRPILSLIVAAEMICNRILKFSYSQ